MNLLIVEDDPFKDREITEFVLTIVPDALIHSATSVSSAVLALEGKSFDFIFLDIALPSHNLVRGEVSPTSMPSGGLEVLLELNFLERSDQVIIVTQYPEVEVEEQMIPLGKVQRKISSILKVNLVGVVQFDKYSDVWKSEIAHILEGI